ncbi:MAG: hypothetical protein H0W15_06005 [Gemmatimonadales bacterium]|nr:hypothetical protein [Gemmatimonadales bacterium]
MTSRQRTPPLPKPVDVALRELSNAMQRLGMYPPGHGHAVSAVRSLHEKVTAALIDRNAITVGITPHGLLIDGIAIEPLPSVLRELASKLHRRNVGTIHLQAGTDGTELAMMVAALAAPDAEEKVGRDGLRLDHLRIEPLIYDVLEFGNPLAEQELDDVFWTQLIEAAFGRRLADTEGTPTAEMIADAITEQSATESGARRVYEALTGLCSAIAVRPERSTISARRRFIDVLTALSRPVTTRVMSAAPSPSSRRRFLRETLSVVPPALVLQVLESVADADRDPISDQLRWLLGRLAGSGDGPTGAGNAAFSAQVVGLVEQWEGTAQDGIDTDSGDPRLSVEGLRVVAIGLEIVTPAPTVIAAARRVAEQGRIAELMQLLDAPANDAATVDTIASAVFEPSVLAGLLRATPIDFGIAERVAVQLGRDAIDPLLDSLDAADDRATRRRLLDVVVRVAPGGSELLLARLPGAGWQLARNIFVVLARLPDVQQVDPILVGLKHPDRRVRHEALKAALGQPSIRRRAVQDAIEGDDPSMTRTALAALDRECPPELIAPVLSVLGHEDPDLQLLAVGLIGDARSPLVVPPLLGLVRTRGGLLQRTRLLPRTPVMLAALQVLASRWSHHRPVMPVLQLAARSDEREVQAALGRIE